MLFSAVCAVVVEEVGGGSRAVCVLKKVGACAAIYGSSTEWPAFAVQ